MLKRQLKAIYIETSVLFKLPLDIINAEMQQLQQWAKLLNVNIYIPEVSLKEWMPKRKEAVQKCVSSADEKINKLAQIFSYVSRIDWGKEKKEIIQDTERVTREILAKHGIQIIPTPVIDLSMLIEMSIHKKRPFEETGEKGFRDSVNLFTVLEFAKSQKDALHLFVAEDGAYRHPDVEEIAKRYNVDLVVVESIPEAISSMKGFVEELVDVVTEWQKSNLKQFLIANKPIIEEYIKHNAQFNTPSSFGEVEEIANIKVDEILTVIIGETPEGSPEGRVKISFNVRTSLELKVKPYIPFPQQRLKYGQKASPQADLWMWTVMPKFREPEYNTVPYELQIEGTVFRRLEKQNEGLPKEVFTDLEIERIVS